MIKGIFELFNRAKQAEKMHLNQTRLYRFTAGDTSQLSALQIKEYSALLKESADKAIEYLDSVVKEKEQLNN